MPLEDLKKSNPLALVDLRNTNPFNLELGGIGMQTSQTTPQTTERGNIPLEFLQGITRSGGSVGLTLTGQEE